MLLTTLKVNNVKTNQWNKFIVPSDFENITLLFLRNIKELSKTKNPVNNSFTGFYNSISVARTGFEPVFPPWKGGVLGLYTNGPSAFRSGCKNNQFFEKIGKSLEYQP